MQNRSGRSDCPDFASLARQEALEGPVVEQVLACFASRLKAAAVRRCGNEALAEDALQETLLTALRSISSYRGEAPVEGWLRSVLVSSCSRLRRGRKNDADSHLSFEEWVETGEEPLGDAGLELLQQELSRDLERVLEEIHAMPEPNRSLFYLHEVEGLSLTELAERFELSAEAIKARLKRSRSLLRDRLQLGSHD